MDRTQEGGHSVWREGAAIFYYTGVDGGGGGPYGHDGVRGTYRQGRQEMSRWSGYTTVLAVAAGLLLGGCGPGALQEGDLLESTQELRVNGESVWEDGTTEAFTYDTPAGTVFRVLYAQRGTLDIIECEPIKVDKHEDAAYIIERFLPPHLRNRFGFKSFSVTLNLADIGTKLKRLEKPVQ
jgi:hypothetical protein